MDSAKSRRLVVLAWTGTVLLILEPPWRFTARTELSSSSGLAASRRVPSRLPPDWVGATLDASWYASAGSSISGARP